MSDAERANAQGQDLFKLQKFAEAIVYFTRAIQYSEEDECQDDDISERPSKDPRLHTYYANRSLAHIELENYGSGLADASKAVEIKSDFRKGWYRRGLSHLALGRVKEAEQDFNQVCTLAPKDPDARDKLRQCKQILQEELFAKSIAKSRERYPSENIDLQGMQVDGSYTGPVYLSGKLTPELCQTLMEWQRRQKNLATKHAYEIVLDVIQVLKHEPTLVEIQLPAHTEITICGDIHGQYYDLLNIFEINGLPSEENPYLFNGDFVDRGCFSVEVLLTLFMWKLLYPTKVFLGRGNHEARSMNMLYGFEGEVTAKYDKSLYELFSEAFCLLPLCHLVNKTVLVLHGGLFSEDGVTLQNIRSLDRMREPPYDGLMADLLWSDPHPGFGRRPSRRGVGVAFGRDVTEEFMQLNGLSLVIRSHEMKEEGYEVEHGGKLVTVFSAPNYCDQMGNKGAILRLDADTLSPRFITFEAAAHPPVSVSAYTMPVLGQLMRG